jgi:hypothetical protein
VLSAAPQSASALTLDERNEMRLGMRAYTAARIGTEEVGSEDNPLNYPHSEQGHLRQHRYFLELKFDHDIKRLGTTTKGLAWLLGWMDPSKLRYSIQYRGEGDGIYDYGPSEYSHPYREIKSVRNDVPDLAVLGLSPVPPDEFAEQRADRLRRIARQRHRFFLGYLDIEKGPVFVRVGRQILAWGETDVFRLLDNINPLDDSFGGFFIALDERRLPLDMLRASYSFGSIGPLADAFLEGFGALGNRVSTDPGIPPGSPWEPGGLGRPLPNLETTPDVPDKDEFRGGARFVFNFKDVTYTIGHYYTYFDVPGVRFRLPGQVQLPGEAAPSNTARFGNPIRAIQEFPRVPVTGASLTFPLSRFYTVVRSEAAYFQGEPMNKQGSGSSLDSVCPGGFGCPEGGNLRLKRLNNTEGGLNPFVYPRFLDLPRVGPINGTTLRRDTMNFALGLDVNRFVRWLNPTQTFFISTQFFYKHVFDAPDDLVLPVVYRNLPVDPRVFVIGSQCGGFVPGQPGSGRPCRLQPRLFHLDNDRFLHTLLITTSYSGGRIVPQYGMFYDWQGAMVFQPGVTFIRDRSDSSPTTPGSRARRPDSSEPCATATTSASRSSSSSDPSGRRTGRTVAFRSVRLRHR